MQVNRTIWGEFTALKEIRCRSKQRLYDNDQINFILRLCLFFATSIYDFATDLNTVSYFPSSGIHLEKRPVIWYSPTIFLRLVFCWSLFLLVRGLSLSLLFVSLSMLSPHPLPLFRPTRCRGVKPKDLLSLSCRRVVCCSFPDILSCLILRLQIGWFCLATCEPLWPSCKALDW